MDSNRAIVEGTEAYMQHGGSGPVLIVTPIERCGENSDLDKMLKDMFYRGRHEQTFVVLTKIDQINKLNARARKNLSHEHSTQLRTAEDSLEQHQAEFQTLSPCAQSNVPTLDPAELQGRLAAQARQKELNVLISRQKNRIRQIAVEDRNGRAKACLRDKFRTLSGLNHAPDLEVVCVSGHEYRKYLECATGEDGPWLGKEATGFPEWQRLILRIPATKKFDALRKICSHSVPYLFRGIVKTLTEPEAGGNIAGTSELRSRLRRSWVEYRTSAIDLLEQDMRCAYEVNITQFFRASSTSDTWKGNVDGLVDQWSRYHTVTFRTFCKRFGVWKPKFVRTVVNWNVSVEATFASDAGARFAALRHRVSAIHSALGAGIAKIFKRLDDILAEDAYHNLPGKDDLLSVIHEANSEMQTLLDRLFLRLGRNLDKLYANLTMGNGNDQSYVSRALHDGYVHAASIDRDSLDRKTLDRMKLDGRKISPGRRAHEFRVSIIRRHLLGGPADPSEKKARRTCHDGCHQ
jgi:hypothetical protein